MQVSSTTALFFLTVNSAYLRLLKNLVAVFAMGVSKSIVIATFKFPYYASIIEIAPLIVESSDTLPIVGWRDQDRVKLIGSNQRDVSIALFNGPPMSVHADRGHLLIRLNYTHEYVFIEGVPTELHCRFGFSRT